MFSKYLTLGIVIGAIVAILIAAVDFPVAS